MKKYVMQALVCSSLLFSGCAQKAKVVEVNKMDEVEEVLEVAEDSNHVKWIVEPSIDAVKFELFEHKPSEYGDQFCDGHTKISASRKDGNGTLSDLIYIDENSCGVISNEGFQVYNFDGSPISEFVSGDFTEEYFCFMPFPNIDDNQKYVGDLMLLELGDKVMYGNFVIEDKKTDIVGFGDEGYFSEDFVMDDTVYTVWNDGQKENIEPARSFYEASNDFYHFVHVVEDVYQPERKVIGIAALDYKYEILKKYLVEGVEQANYSKVVNRYFNVLGVDGRIITMNYDDGRVVTRNEYDKVGSFSEGYFTVCKDGKWGIIDENGTLVCDVIFDDLSTVYNGRVFVIKDGKAGILDLKDAVDRGIFVNAESL